MTKIKKKDLPKDPENLWEDIYSLTFETEVDRIRSLIILFILIQYFWSMYLQYRQYRLTKATKKVPKEVESVLEDDTFQKARLYSLDKATFGMINDTFGTVLTIFVILTGALGVLWNLCPLKRFEGEISHSCAWLFVGQVLNTLISLPLSIYHTFVLEEKHGFNKQTPHFFVVDHIKSFILSQVITLPLAALTIVIVRNGGDYFFVWLWLAICAVMMILFTIYPTYIAPLFDQFETLPDGELRNAIEELATQLKFPLGEIYVVEGSKRSAHSNAYFAGMFGLKRIVLFDTLIGNDEKPGCTTEQIIAVLAHELGHWKHGHIIKNLIAMQVNLFLAFAAFAYIYAYDPLYTVLGFHDDNVRPVLVGIMSVFMYVLGPYFALLGFAMTIVSRRFEYQADKFAVNLGKAEPLKEALIWLMKNNLGFPVYDHWYSTWYHSHPPLLQRLDALSKAD